MAERRMFAKSIINSDAFLEMPLSAQALYFHLGMRADDDGFVNNPRKIMRLVSCSDDDMRLLIVKHFIIPFDSGVVVLKHWRIHNYIRSDRYKETNYIEEKALLKLKENNAYTLDDTLGIPSDIPTVYPDKESIGKDSKGKGNSKFTPPTIEEVEAYINEKGYDIDAHKFIDYYTANGWKVGRNPMKDYKAAIRNWARNDYSKDKNESGNPWMDMLRKG